MIFIFWKWAKVKEIFSVLRNFEVAGSKNSGYFCGFSLILGNSRQLDWLNFKTGMKRLREKFLQGGGGGGGKKCRDMIQNQALQLLDFLWLSVSICVILVWAAMQPSNFSGNQKVWVPVRK